MFKHSVVYVDFNNKPHNEDLYFHMMQPEFADLEYNPHFGEGSLSDYVKNQIGSGEGRKIHTVFKLLVINSYGRRSEDGSRFHKKPEWTEDFLNSQAWEQFFIWLTDDEKNAQAFFNGIFPESMREQVETAVNKQQLEAGKPKTSLSEMSREDLEAAIQKLTSK